MSCRKKYRASDFLKKQMETKRVNSCLTHCSQKKKRERETEIEKKEMSKKHPQVFLKIGVPNRKILRKWNYEEVPGWRPALHLL